MKLRRIVALMVTFAALAGGTVALATAQETKGKAKTAPADDKKAAGKIEIFEGKKGWRYRVLNDKDKVIAMPASSYEKKEDVLKELENIKGILTNVKPVEVKE